MLRSLFLVVTFIAAFKVPFAFSQVEFEPPVIISPANPVAGQPVFAAVFKETFPPCLIIPQENVIGETHSLIVEDTVLNLNILAFPNPICVPVPASPAPRELYPLGVLAAGHYTLHTDYITAGDPQSTPPFPLPDSFPEAPYGPPVHFTVLNAPRSVDNLAWPGLILLVLGTLITASLVRRL